ncbi:hypothetical protein [Mobiluncus mulieris]|uniref:hypothetical protein n=1 Tax=Mobiluncus mulieris TaxID=2052 RepID=UPI0014700144|nr:hypothetical protein [Mobiluncus mulieris]NMW91987.1 hypothetical protein [Mobiluncus mulieris]
MRFAYQSLGILLKTRVFPVGAFVPNPLRFHEVPAGDFRVNPGQAPHESGVTSPKETIR